MFNKKAEELLKVLIMQNELLATMKIVELTGKIDSGSYEALDKAYRSTSKVVSKAIDL